jgi:hypothetical protein
MGYLLSYRWSRGADQSRHGSTFALGRIASNDLGRVQDVSDHSYDEVGNAPSFDDLLRAYGSARRPDRPPAHGRPRDVDGATVTALGKLSAALETAEDARGHLYSFHRLSGRADLDLQDAVTALRDAGHAAVADAVADLMVGRDVTDGKWTFQLVEEYDAGYMTPFRAAERAARHALGNVPEHLFEAEMKHREQS